MQLSRPYVLSIAGYDPCAGAGVLADIKTFEQHKVYGIAVITSLTFQTERNFHKFNFIMMQVHCNFI